MKCLNYTILLVFILPLTPIVSKIHAEVWNLGGGLYAAGVRSDEFEFTAAPQGMGRQWQDQWCWAASIQMVLNFHGIPVTQPEIVNRGLGAVINQGGDEAAILRALNNMAIDVRGLPVQIVADSQRVSTRSIVEALSNKWPLIVGLTMPGIRHAVVLTAVEYSISPNGDPIPVSAIIRDPWPMNQSLQRIPWADFLGACTFAAHVYIER